MSDRNKLYVMGMDGEPVRHSSFYTLCGYMVRNRTTSAPQAWFLRKETAEVYAMGRAYEIIPIYSPDNRQDQDEPDAAPVAYVGGWMP